MKKNPYFIEGPALISFSGGRTSGYMLKHIIDAHGGTLPDDVYIVFADTGLEHGSTYKFVKDCADKWDQPIWTVALDRGNHATPFDALISRKKYLPNPVARFCTGDMKVKMLAGFMRERGHDSFLNVVGIRADERKRVAKMRGRTNDGWDNCIPLADANVSEQDVLSWWRVQPFDLGIPPGYGNCVGCFLKSAAQLVSIEQAMPGSLAWWAEKEKEIGGTFRSDRPSYAKLIEFSSKQQAFDFGTLEPSLPCSCTD